MAVQKYLSCNFWRLKGKKLFICDIRSYHSLLVVYSNTMSAATSVLFVREAHKLMEHAPGIKRMRRETVTILTGFWYVTLYKSKNMGSTWIFLSLGYEPKHVLWTLLFLKTYGTGAALCTVLKIDEKTFKKWTWKSILSIASLKPVRN